MKEKEGIFLSKLFEKVGKCLAEGDALDEGFDRRLELLFSKVETLLDSGGLSKREVGFLSEKMAILSTKMEMRQKAADLLRRRR